jgi:hypothetical protein
LHQAELAREIPSDPELISPVFVSKLSCKMKNPKEKGVDDQLGPYLFISLLVSNIPNINILKHICQAFLVLSFLVLVIDEITACFHKR